MLAAVDSLSKDELWFYYFESFFIH